jgi:minor extracellular serine protease Vpr
VAGVELLAVRVGRTKSSNGESEMRRILKRALLLAVGAGLVATVGAAAAPQDDTPSASVAGFERLSGVENLAGFTPAMVAADRQISVIVQIAGDPVAKRGNQLSKEQKEQIRAELKQAQAPARERIQALGGSVLYDYQDAYNGVAARVALKDLAAVAQAPNVVGVHPSRTFERDNTAGVQYILGDAAWNDVGATGDGVKVAILDTGVDYTHANFGGPGTEAAFEDNDGTVVESGSFPTDKVVGGTDLVGDDYDASSDDPAQATPKPDPDPLDCNGHGSHVAGTAAGFGVLSDGTTFAGPYDSSTHTDNTFRVGPGVAPEALILAYRVFGCEGSASEEVIVAAIDTAVEGGADVINMSLGSPFGRTDEPSAEASDAAVDAGVVVVASAGNSGPGAYITGSPAAAGKALSVAAVDASSPTFPGAVLETTAGPITAIVANGAALPGGSFPIKVLRTATGGVSLGCDPQEYLDQNVTGTIVVTVRGVCARVARAIFGQQAGAAAVVMINTNSGLPPFEGEITSNPDTGEKFTVTIPFLGVRGCLGTCPTGTDTADGDNLVASDGTSTTLTATTVVNPGYKGFASFTSGGPRNVDSAVKPEIIAPGVSVVSTGMGTGNKSATISGTSMAAPMTAGAAALVVGANPTWSAEQVKAALMNTSNATADKITAWNARRGGAGVVDVRRAIDSVGYATTGPGRASLDFGFAASSTATHSQTKQLTLHNTGASPIAYDLTATSTAISFPGGTSVNVPAGGMATVDVTITLNAATLPPAEASIFGGLVTAAGAVTATPTTAGPGIYPLRVPFLLAPRGLSNVTLGTPTPYAKDKGSVRTRTVEVSNDGIHAGNADVYAWGISDPDDVSGAEDGMDVRAAGLQVLPREFLCGEDPPGECGTADDHSLVFAVNMYGRFSNPSVSEIDIPIDLQNDGKADFWVIGVDLGAVTAGSFDGRFASFVFDADFNILNAWVAIAPMNGSTLLLPTLASDIGLGTSKGSTRLNYAVGAFSTVPEGLVDVTQSASFRVDQPPVSTGDSVALAPGASETLSLSADKGKNAATPQLGWLVITTDDANGGAQADQIPIGNLP